jgi:hypothetical protein
LESLEPQASVPERPAITKKSKRMRTSMSELIAPSARIK